ncbi:hypothetical protein ACWGB8_27820 [Kitasatospora sp. NPDC054939]
MSTRPTPHTPGGGCPVAGRPRAFVPRQRTAGATGPARATVRITPALRRAARTVPSLVRLARLSRPLREAEHRAVRYDAPEWDDLWVC